MGRALNIAIPTLLALSASACGGVPDDTVGSSVAAASGGHRAAALIGARSLDFAVADAKIGPLQDQRLFYTDTLPASFSGSEGASLPAGVTAVISYKGQTTNVVSFIKSLPAERPVIMIFHHEPENDYGPNGSEFVSEFTKQSALIRSAKKANVKVAMAAMTYQYVDGRAGESCTYIPPASAVDFYLADNYETTPTGAGLAADSHWLNWLKCVDGRGKPLGLAEYGLALCNATDADREKTMHTDDAYLKAHFSNFALWSYWWMAPPAGDDTCNLQLQFTDTATVREWKAIESGS